MEVENTAEWNIEKSNVKQLSIFKTFLKTKNAS